MLAGCLLFCGQLSFFGFGGAETLVELGDMLLGVLFDLLEVRLELLLVLLADLSLKVELILDTAVVKVSSLGQLRVAELKTDLLAVGPLGSILQVKLLKVSNLKVEVLQVAVFVVAQLVCDDLVLLLEEHQTHVLGLLLVLDLHVFELLPHFFLQVTKELIANVAHCSLIEHFESIALANLVDLDELVLAGRNRCLESLVELALKLVKGLLSSFEALIFADVGPTGLD